MPNSIIARPSERVTWGCSYTSPVNIAKANGVITGALSYDKVKGAYFDGVNDYITHSVDSRIFANGTYFSAVVEFTPDFNYDDDNFHDLIDASNGSRYRIVKTNTANTHALYLYLGNAVISYVPSVTYGPYWKQGKRNVLVISATSGNNNMWLNGTQIMVNEVTAWSPMSPTQLFVGSNYAGSNKFQGSIHSIKIFASKTQGLTTQDALDYYNKSTYKYMNKADVWLDMSGQAVNNDSKTITKDKSGNGRDFMLGDGTTTSTFPTFTNNGFSFDGGDYMLNSNATGIYNNTYQTFVIAFKPNFPHNYDAYRYLYDGSLGKRYLFGKANNAGNNDFIIYFGNTSLGAISEALYSPHWKINGLNVVINTGTSGNTTTYWNGVPIRTSSNAWSPADPDTIHLCSSYGYGLLYTGGIQLFSVLGKVFPQKMTQTQVNEITAYLMSKYS